MAFAFGIDDEPSFCTLESYESCSQYVDQALDRLGLPPVHIWRVLSPPDRDHESGVRVLNVLHRLLGLHAEAERRVTAQMALTHRAADDLLVANAAQGRLRDQIDALEREAGVASEALRQLQLKLRRAEDDARGANEAVKKLKASVEYVKNHVGHENKRRERDAQAVREKLAKLVQEKGGDRAKSGMQMASPLVRLGGKRGTWARPEKAGDDLQRQTVEHFESHVRELTTENGALRSTLAVLYAELAELADVADDLDIRAEQFQRPFAAAQNGIEGAVKARLAALRQKIAPPATLVP